MVKKIFLALFLFIILAIVGAFFYMQTLKPTYNGNQDLQGIDANIEVFYDDYGVPHIYADSDKDAWHALGYVHAQDRLWQMELLRRVGAGRLSELFGSNTLETDKLFRTLGIQKYSEKSADRFTANAPQEIQDKIHAYLSGVNQFIDHGSTPIEHHLLGAKKSHFDLVDVYNVVGYMAFSFGISHRTEPILSFIKNKRGDRYLEDLGILVDTSKQVIESFPENDLSQLSIEMDKLLHNLPVPSFLGSNSWVLGPNKTASGKVIFANDPHIGFSQPAVWYEAHIETPSTNLYGYFLAGSPLPQMGHTKHIATGLTMLLNDDTDFFYEEIKDDTYKYNDEWLPIIERSDTIKIRNNTDHIITVRETIHGPIVNDVFETFDKSTPVSIWWSYLNNVNYTLEGAHDLLTSKEATQVPIAASKIHAPGLNVMYGDDQDNFAWWATAKLVKRTDPNKSKFIHDGTNTEGEAIGYYDFSENPSSLNPESGFVFSANNQTKSKSGIYHEGYYVPEDRAKKIVSLIEPKDDWNVDDVKKMVLNFNSLIVPKYISSLASIVKDKDLSDGSMRLINQLSEWDGTFDGNQSSPTIYVKLITELSDKLFKDELGQKTFSTFVGTPAYNKSLPNIIYNEASVWWDDITTKDKIESSADIVTEALESTYTKLSNQLGGEVENWKWENVHSLEHEHALGQVSGLKSFFNVGPYPVGGWDEVINNMHTLYSTSGIYKVNAGPSTRRIVDFADVENNSWSISPTGQSGNPFSPHYNDQAEMFIQGKFKKQKMNKSEIQAEFKNKLIFIPN